MVLLTSSVYIMLPNEVRIDVEKTRTTFQVYEDGEWILSGVEYVNLFDGTKKMRASSRDLDYFIEGNISTITRTANYKDGIITVEVYVFNGSSSDVRMYPVSHNIQVLNGEGKLLQYEVQKLLYDGETIKGIPSPQEFGHQMKVEWGEGNYYSRIWKYSGIDQGKLTVKYRIDSQFYEKDVRLFDPPIENNNLIVESGETVTLGGDNDTYDIVWVKAGGTLNVNTSDKYLNLTANNITIDGTVNGLAMYAGGNGGICSNDADTGATGTGEKPGSGGQGLDQDFCVVALGGGGGGNAVSGGNGGNYKCAFDIWKYGGAGGGAQPTTSLDLNFSPGSGGGEGGCSDHDYPNPEGGAGGNGAGVVIFNAPVVTIHGTINLYGTSGSAGIRSGAGGGGGGSGGTLGIYGTVIDLSSSTLKVNGGSGGAGTSDSWATGGGTGAGGRLKIFYSTLDTTSMSTTLGTGIYSAVQIPEPNATLISDNSNFTIANITGYCGGEINFSIGDMTLYWNLYKNDILNSSGITAEYSSEITVNVVNISSTELIHNDTWTLECIGSDSVYNNTADFDLQVHQPAWIDITYPSQDEEIGTAWINITYSFENYTSYDNCWYTNDSGVTNTTMDCDGIIGSVNWLEGQNNVSLYSNVSSESYIAEDSIDFFIVLTAPSIVFEEETPSEAEWINVNTFTAGCEVEPCRNFDNLTIELRGESFI
ncbi:MAG: hypothetical protein ACTSU7_00275 [Candidatus Heimdallarchaeaceae archaeon]